MYFHTYNQTENTRFSQKMMTQHFLVAYIINLFSWAKFFSFWWNALDIARISFKSIQNFKFKIFQNSLHPNIQYMYEGQTVSHIVI